MGGGLMQLVAYGAQDIYITGNPQMTFFKAVYKRHTNFAIESIEQSINGPIGSGGKVSVTVARNGDLLSRMYIQIKDNESSDKGFDAIDYVEVEIGGQVIDKHYGAWMKIWCDLTHGSDKKAMLNEMLCDAKGCGCGESSNTSYIPLQFWFCKNTGLSLPLIALQYHEVKLNIKFCNVSGASAEVWCDYIFLDTDERRRFAQASHEYLIEQVQYNNGAPINNTVDLRFNHPIKELVWRAVTGDVGCCSNTNGLDDICDAVLQLNGIDRFQKRSGDYFSVVQRYEHHTGAKTSAPPPTGTQWTGLLQSLLRLKIEIIAYKTHQLTFNPGESPGGTLQNFIDAIETARQALEDAHATSTVTQQLLDDLSGANFDEYTYVNLFPGGGPASGPAPQMRVPIETSINVLLSSSVDDWNDDLSGEVDAPTSSSCVNAGTIYSYSFAVKPEEHQPSGTCNFSRIDNAVMQVNLNTDPTATKLDVYAVNYNILRIMSGMGGIAYSN